MVTTLERQEPRLCRDCIYLDKLKTGTTWCAFEEMPRAAETEGCAMWRAKP